MPILDPLSLDAPKLDASGLDGSALDAPDLAAPAHTASPVTDSISASLYAKLALLDATGDVRPLDEIESEVIRFAIAHYRGQMSEVARRLQIGRSTLYRKLDSLGLTTEPQSSPPQPVVNG
jgi:DNA-binding NtrC family response regulator